MRFVERLVGRLVERLFGRLVVRLVRKRLVVRLVRKRLVEVIKMDRRRVFEYALSEDCNTLHVMPVRNLFALNHAKA